MGRADVYSQPEAPDPVLPVELVQELARRHLPDDVRLSGGMEVNESGGEARVYLLDRRDGGGGVSVKTQRPHRLRPRTSLRKEAALLAALAERLAGGASRSSAGLVGRWRTSATPPTSLVTHVRASAERVPRERGG
jgi:hypothetical protein